jgi:hypothetical protein
VIAAPILIHLTGRIGLPKEAAWAAFMASTIDIAGAWPDVDREVPILMIDPADGWTTGEMGADGLLMVVMFSPLGAWRRIRDREMQPLNWWPL